MIASSLLEGIPKDSRSRGQGAEIPDMHHRHHQRNVAHALAAHSSHSPHATVADDALVTDTLVLAAMALVVFHGTEDTLAEKTVAPQACRPDS